MAVTLIAGTPLQSTTSVTSGVATLPSGLEASDYTFLFCTMSGAAAVITEPAGWSTAFASAQSTVSTALATAIYFKAWESGDTDPTVTCTSGRLVILPVKVSGADTSNPFEGTVGSTTQGTATTDVDAPSQTSTDSRLLVTAHSGRHTTINTFITWTPPAGMSELAEAGGADTLATNASIEVATLIIPPGATGAQTATASLQCTGSRGISMLFKEAAINPPILESGAVTAVTQGYRLG